ncbi:ABC transporter substrate-binding protein [Aquihabitans sp. G128]|uniref:ABC transporter substrate-binding protein n=1 Tax=Aquihabitans sp. G128 TaxID=2849779 RepID=UPI001C213A21|nr:ABC transporter substrate-binding protein [Aquihabitans sp. G128]QXC59716.1 ABC transporter substrate-binding protein [Aquihabitans sp. G128]
MRTTSKSARLGAVAISAALLLAACGSDSKSDGASDKTTTTAKGDATTTTGDEATTTTAAGVDPADNGGRKEGDGTLQLGAVLPQSGNLAQLGPPMISGAKYAVEEINKAGGVLGKDVTLEVKDDGGGGDDALALTNAESLVNNDGIDALVGAAPSGTTKAILDSVVSSGTAECSPSNTGSDLSQADDKGLYFRTPPPDNLQAQALAKVVTDDGNQNVAIIAQNTDYGTGFVRFLDPALTDSGAKVVADVTYDETGTGIDSEVEKVVGSEPDAVVLIGYPEDGGKVVAEMLKQGVDLSKVTVYVTDGMQSNTLYEAVDASKKDITAGIRGTAASAAPENGAAFFPKGFAAFAPEVKSPIYSAQSFDCVILFALAAEKAKSDAPFDIAKEMTNVSKGESADATKCSTYKECKDLLADGKDINYEGASGALDFTAVGEPSAGSYDVYTYGDDGTYKTDEQVVVGS